MHGSYYNNNKLNSKHNKHNNKQQKHQHKQYNLNNKQNKHGNKHSNHNITHTTYNNTWFSTPKKARNPGHANHVFKKKHCENLKVTRVPYARALTVWHGVLNTIIMLIMFTIKLIFSTVRTMLLIIQCI